jgi:hypothetical protein
VSIEGCREHFCSAAAFCVKHDFSAAPLRKG